MSDRRLVIDQLALGRLDKPVGAHTEIAQPGSGDQFVEQLGAVLQLGKVIGMQDDCLDAFRA